MENKFDKDMQEKMRMSEMKEAGIRAGALDDEALEQAAGGLMIGYDNCDHCGRSGIPLNWKSIWDTGTRPPGFVADSLLCEDCARKLRGK